MLKVKRLFKTVLRLVLPVLVLVALAAVSASLWLVHTSARIQPNSYLVTPAKYGLLSARGAQVTDEKWTNHDLAVFPAGSGAERHQEPAAASDLPAGAVERPAQRHAGDTRRWGIALASIAPPCLERQ